MKRIDGTYTKQLPQIIVAIHTHSKIRLQHDSVFQHANFAQG